VIIGPKPYQSTHFYIPLRIRQWIFPGKAINIGEYFRIRTSLEVRNSTKSESLSKVHGRESMIFLIYKNIYEPPLIFQIYIAIICSSMLLIHFSCYFGKQRRFLLPGAYAFLTASVHVPLNTVFNQI